MSVGDTESLYSLVQGVNPSGILHVSVDDNNFLYDCGYPRSCGAFYLYLHDSTFKTLDHFVANVFVKPAALAEKVPVTFFDASERRLDASGRWADVLASVGLKTSDGGAVARQTATQVIDESGGDGTKTAAWLAAFFGVSVTTSPPSSTASASAPSTRAGAATSASPVSGAGGVVVILGAAEEQEFLSNPGTGS